MVLLIRFFSLRGRATIPRWLIWLALTSGMIWLGVRALQVAEGAVLVAVYAILGVAMAKLATESVRRLHDCGQSGWLGLKVVPGIAVLLVTACMHWLGTGADPVTWGALGLAVIASALLWLRPGIRGANAYDGSSARSTVIVDGGGEAGLIVAMGFLAAGICFGLLVLAWQGEIARHRQERLRYRETLSSPAGARSPTAFNRRVPSTHP